MQSEGMDSVHYSELTKDSCLYVDIKTWARDSHELFDYEARHVHRKSYYLKHTSRIFRTTQEIKVIPDGYSLPTQAADYLLSVRHRDGRYIVVPADRNIQSTESAPILSRKVWLIVKELPNGVHHLKEGDIVKLGRFKLRVKQLAKEHMDESVLKIDGVELVETLGTPEEIAKLQCRICLLEGESEDDPLVYPCLCRGSIMFVHVSCLRRWIHEKSSTADDDRTDKMSYFFRQSSCELCKAPIPAYFKTASKFWPIINLPKIKPPFLILENYVGTGNHGIHIIGLDQKKELKLGRGHESDVRIADVSISRCHATIRYQNGEFILEDHDSKFGTLVSLRKIQIVEPDQTVSVQVGRTIIALSLKSHPPIQFDYCYCMDDNNVQEDLKESTEYSISEQKYINQRLSTCHFNLSVISQSPPEQFPLKRSPVDNEDSSIVIILDDNVSSEYHGFDRDQQKRACRHLEDTPSSSSSCKLNEQHHQDEA